MEDLYEHFEQWGAVLFFIIIYGIAILFVPFRKKMEKKPATSYIAFVIAFAIEMHGIPFSMLILAQVIGQTLPEGYLWGHTLISEIGYLGLYLNILFAVFGIIIIILGWSRIYHVYWKKTLGTGKVVMDGVYKRIRHPQYTGLMMIALGMMMGWATLTSLIMFPLIVLLYVRLAKQEEKQMISEFGDEYVEYMSRTKRFIPYII